MWSARRLEWEFGGKTIDLMYKSNSISYRFGFSAKNLSVVRFNFVDKECDNPLENTDKKGIAAAGMDLRFASGFHWIAPVSPLKRFERHKVEV